MTLRIGRLRPDTNELNLHAAPNGKIVGVMHRGDRFELDDRPPVRNPGGVKDWAGGRVNMTGDHVWVALERLIVEVFEDRPAPPPPRPKPKPQPARVRSLDVFGALLAAAIVLAILWMLGSAAARAMWPYLFTPAAAQNYDYTSDLHRDCLQAGLKDTSMFGVPLCRVVKIEPLTKSEALKRKLQYRAVAWGKKFPADEDGYFIAESNEFIPQSWSVPSPDENFHRCTYPLNHYWSGPPDNEWKIRAHNETADGLPPTRCFWRPAGK